MILFTVRNVRASEAQWSLQQLKLFSDHNNLIIDYFSSTATPGTYYLFVVLQDLGIYGLTFEPVVSSICSIFFIFSRFVCHSYYKLNIICSRNDVFVIVFVFFQRKVWSAATKVADVHLPPDFANRGDRFGATIAFPNEHLAVVSNGCGQLTLYHTANRPQFAPWKVEAVLVLS